MRYSDPSGHVAQDMAVPIDVEGGATPGFGGQSSTEPSVENSNDSEPTEKKDSPTGATGNECNSEGDGTTSTSEFWDEIKQRYEAWRAFCRFPRDTMIVLATLPPIWLGIDGVLSDLDQIRDSAIALWNLHKAAYGDEVANLASWARTKHILIGESSTAGGHMFPGNPGKSPFPATWDAGKIMNVVSDIATDPSLEWNYQTGSGGLYTKNGKPARFKVVGTVEGVIISVIIEPAGEGIITAFPIGVLNE